MGDNLRGISYEVYQCEAAMNHNPLNKHLRTPVIAVAIAAYLAGCASVTEKNAQRTQPAQTAHGDTVTPPFKGGGYYKDDGPGRKAPANLDRVPDAVPRVEALNARANDPYTVLGKAYTPIPAGERYKERGLASWYGRKFHGRKTSSGEPYDMYAMTAAHATLPIPCYARVTNSNTGQSIVVRVNDRGPFHEGRIIDLSYTAAHKLDVLKGVTPVEVELVNAEAAPDSFIAQAGPSPSPADLPPADAAGAIYLQLGAYTNPASAEALLYRASTKLSRDFPGVMSLNSDGLHKIQAGPFKSEAAADQAAARIREELDVQPIKIKARQPASAAAVPEGSAAKAVATPGLYLQLAALSTTVAAEELSTRVKARFGDQLPGIDRLTVGQLIKVQAGPFLTAASAERLAMAYQQDFGTTPYKVQR